MYFESFKIFIWNIGWVKINKTTISNKLKEFQGCRVIVSGSIVGTEQYAFSKRLFSKASQTLLIFEDENLIDIKINLQK